MFNTQILCLTHHLFSGLLNAGKTNADLYTLNQNYYLKINRVFSLFQRILCNDLLSFRGFY